MTSNINLTKNFKVIILVMCSSAYKFKKLEKAIKKTWGSKAVQDVKIIFYTDNQRVLFKKRNAKFNDPDLTLPCKDGYYECTRKTLLAFDFIRQEFSFEYVFRTNLGSYVNSEHLLSFLDAKSQTGFYSGIPGSYQSSEQIIPFASGSGYFLSRDLVELIADHQHDVDQNLIDDVAVGKFLNKKGFVVNGEATRLNIVNGLISYQKGYDTLTNLEHDQIYHVRLRSDDRSLDIKKMHELHNIRF